MVRLVALCKADVVAPLVLFTFMFVPRFCSRVAGGGIGGLGRGQGGAVPCRVPLAHECRLVGTGLRSRHWRT